MSAINNYGNVLAPTDPAISPYVYAHWSANDPACFPGGVYPAEDANITAWTDLVAGRTITKTGSNYARYKSNLNGLRAVHFWNSFAGSCPGFFGNGSDWAGYGIFALVNLGNDGVTYGNAIRTFSTSGNNQKILLTFKRTGAVAAINNNAASVGSPWAALGACKGVGIDIQSPVAGRRNRLFADGTIVYADGANVQQPTPIGTDVATDLQLNNAFAGVWSISELIVVKKHLEWDEAAGLGFWLMQRAGIPRRPNTIIATGNSMTERSGFVSFLSPHFNAAADGAAEIWDTAVSGGTRATLEEQRPDIDRLVALAESQDRTVIFTCWPGHNDGGWTTAAPPTDPDGGPSGLPAQLKNYFAGYRADGHRLVVIGTTPSSAWSSSSPLAACDAYLATMVPTQAEAVVRTYLTAWADEYTDAGPPTGLNYGGYYVDTVHLTDAGYTAFAALAAPTILDELRRAWASRATCQGGVGAIDVARHAGAAADAALADLAVRAVPAGSAAPTTGVTPNLTLATSVSSGSFSVAAGSWDVYASQAGSTPVKIATTTVTTADSDAPTITSASLASNGLTLTVDFSEPVAAGGLPSGLSVSVAGSSRPATAAAPSGSSIVLSLASPARAGESITLSYAPGNIQDLAGNALAAVSGYAVTNGSVVQPLAVSLALSSKSTTTAAIAATATGGSGARSWTWTVGGTPVSGATTPNLSLSGLTPATTYAVAVSVSDSTGPASASLSVTTDAAPPEEPGPGTGTLTDETIAAVAQKVWALAGAIDGEEPRVTLQHIRAALVGKVDVVQPGIARHKRADGTTTDFTVTAGPDGRSVAFGGG